MTMQLNATKCKQVRCAKVDASTSGPSTSDLGRGAMSTMEQRERRPPGTERPARWVPRFHYELISCGLRGHMLVGMDAERVRPEDELLVREPADGLRWHRCVRCDAWVPMAKP